VHSNMTPNMNPQLKKEIKSESKIMNNRSGKRPLELYVPYLSERDSLGRLIGDGSTDTTHKNSPRRILPSVYQFNKKWSTRKSVKSNVKGDWESREISYGADLTTVINQ